MVTGGRPMFIEIRHRFEDAELADVERLYMLDEGFNERTFNELGYNRRVLVNERRGERLVRTLHLIPTRALPAPFSVLVRDGSFHITEHVEDDFAEHRGTWTTTPSVLSNQFNASGTSWFEHDSSGAALRVDGAALSTIRVRGRSGEKPAVRAAAQQASATARAVRTQAPRRADGAQAAPDLGRSRHTFKRTAPAAAQIATIDHHARGEVSGCEDDVVAPVFA